MSGALRSAVTLLLLAPLCVHAAPVAPGCRELEQRGARIGTIQIQVDDVFRDPDAPRRAVPHRQRSAHISTHDATVQNQLLFHTGDKYDHRVLDETARILRAQRYLNEGDCRASTLQRGRQYGGRDGARPRRVDAEPRPVIRPQGRREQQQIDVRRHEFPRPRQTTDVCPLSQTSIAPPGSLATSIRICSAAGGGCRRTTQR